MWEYICLDLWREILTLLSGRDSVSFATVCSRYWRFAYIDRREFVLNLLIKQGYRLMREFDGFELLMKK